MRNRLVFLVMVLVFATALSGCQNATSNTTDPIVGTWSGTSLGTADQTGVTIVIVSGNTWSMTGSHGTASGTWTKSGSSYVITQTSQSGVGSGTVNGNTLTMTNGSTTSIYTRS